MFEPWQLRQSAAEILSVSGSPGFPPQGDPWGPRESPRRLRGQGESFWSYEVFATDFTTCYLFFPVRNGASVQYFRNPAFVGPECHKCGAEKRWEEMNLKPVSLDPTEPQPQPNPNPTLVHPSTETNQATTRAFDASSCQCHAPFGGWLKAGDRRAGGEVPSARNVNKIHETLGELYILPWN